MADTNPCQNELDIADSCIQLEGAEACSCFQPIESFVTDFPPRVTSAYDTAITSANPDEDGYCGNINEQICGFIETEASCCCLTEMITLNLCTYTKSVIPNYEDFQCTDGGTCNINADGDGSGGSGNGDDDGDGSLLDMAKNNDAVVYGVGISLVLLAISFIVFCLCSRRRRRRRRITKKGKGVNVNVQLSGQNQTNTTTEHHKETTIEKKTKKTRSSKNDVLEEYVNNDESSSSGDDAAYDWSAWELTKHTRGSFDEEAPPPKRKKKKRKKKKKVVKEDSESSDDEENITRTIKTIRITNSNERSSKKKKKSKKKSKRRLTDEEYSETETYDDPSFRSYEQSMRQARTMIDDLDNDPEKKKKHIIAIMPNLQEIIDLLNEEKRILQQKTREVEEQKITLQSEVEADQAKMKSLETHFEDAHKQLTKAQLNKEFIQTKSITSATMEETNTDGGTNTTTATTKDVLKMKAMAQEMSELLVELQEVQKTAEKECVQKEQEVRTLKMERTYSQKSLLELEIQKVEEEKLVAKEEFRNAELGSKLSLSEQPILYKRTNSVPNLCDIPVQAEGFGSAEDRRQQRMMKRRLSHQNLMQYHLEEDFQSNHSGQDDMLKRRLSHQNLMQYHREDDFQPNHSAQAEMLKRRLSHQNLMQYHQESQSNPPEQDGEAERLNMMVKVEELKARKRRAEEQLRSSSSSNNSNDKPTELIVYNAVVDSGMQSERSSATFSGVDGSHRVAVPQPPQQHQQLLAHHHLQALEDQQQRILSRRERSSNQQMMMTMPPESLSLAYSEQLGHQYASAPYCTQQHLQQHLQQPRLQHGHQSSPNIINEQHQYYMQQMNQLHQQEQQLHRRHQSSLQLYQPDSIHQQLPQLQRRHSSLQLYQ